MASLKFLFLSLLILFISPANAARKDVLKQLQQLQGVEASEITTTSDRRSHIRRFEIFLQQPEDHFTDNGKTFPQKIILFHRNYHAPMVLQTSGYAIFSEGLSQLASTFQTNQIQVEHRFFGTSIPEAADWTKLTVAQSAADFHKVVQTFKQLYNARWVNTGTSKGGMTSVFHRRFYPDDVDGTLALVAPLEFSLEDERFIDFVDQIGGDKYAECRADLEAIQIAALERREELYPFIDGNFSIIGGKETALEHLIIELPFSFWQYGDPASNFSGCSTIPTPKAPITEIYDFISSAASFRYFTNSTIELFKAYYYQANYELGAPATKMSHLQHLLQFNFHWSQYLPDLELPIYSNKSMLDMQNWISKEAEGIIFIYGEFDPWTAAAFDRLKPFADNSRYFVAGGNHSVNFPDLSKTERKKVLKTLARWLKRKPRKRAYYPSILANEAEKPLETLEYEAIRKLKTGRENSENLEHRKY